MQKPFAANAFSLQNLYPVDFSVCKKIPRKHFSFKNFIPQIFFHAKTFNLHFVWNPYPANNFSFKNPTPRIFYHSKTLPRKHIFMQKPLTYMWPFGMHRTQCAQTNWKCLVSKWIGAEDKLKAKLIKQLVRMAPCNNWGISICLFLFFYFYNGLWAIGISAKTRLKRRAKHFCNKPSTFAKLIKQSRLLYAHNCALGIMFPTLSKS